MILTLLQAHLLAPLALSMGGSPAPLQSSDLLSTIPDGAIVAFHAPSPKSLIASRDTSDWVQFMLDARWELIIDDLATLMGEEAAAKEIQAARRVFIDALADTNGAVGFLDWDPETKDVTACLVAQAGPECSALLRRFVGEDAAPQTLADGKSVLVGEAGRAELFYEGEGMVVLVSAKSIEASKAVAEGCLARLGNAGAGGPFAVPGVAKERGNAALEFAVNLAPVWDMAAEDLDGEGDLAEAIADSARTIEWLYGSIGFGDGEAAEWKFVAPYGVDTLIGEAMGFFGEADPALFRTVPAGAQQATVFSFDLSGMADWVLAQVATENEDAHAQAEAAIEGAGQAVGFDIMNDVVRNLEGQFVYYTTGEVMKIDGMELPGAFAMTVISYVKDSDVMIDVADTLLQLGGIASDLDSGERTLPGEDGEVELWTSSKSSGTKMALGVGAGRVAFSMSPTDLTSYFDLASGAEGIGRMLDNKVLAKTAKGLRGTAISIQSTAIMADSVRQMVNSYADMMESLAGAFGDEGDDLVPMRSAADRLAGMVEQYFEGATTTELQIGGGMIRANVRSR